MTQKSLAVALTDESAPTIPVPKTFQQIGTEATEALWRVAHQISVEEITKVRNASAKQEVALTEKYNQAQAIIESRNKEIASLKRHIESLERENKALDNDLDTKNTQLDINHAQLVDITERYRSQEHEVKRLLEEQGRLQESVDSLQRRFDEAMRHNQYQDEKLRITQEEVTVQNRQRERLEQALESSHEEIEQHRERAKAEQIKTASAEGAAHELRDSLKRMEQEVKQLKGELHDRREALVTENKTRQDIEKKLAMLTGQQEAQERNHRDSIAKLEQELQSVKTELQTARSRMIKAEGALERETKRVERLENKLIAGR